MRPHPRWSRRAILTVEVLESRTVPSFAAPTAFDLGAAPAGVAVGHFNDAAAPLDVVTANANGTVSVLLGRGDGTVQIPISLTVGGTPVGVAVGDFLGNGLDDIAVANSNGTVTVLVSNGNNTFKAPQTFSVGATPVALAVGDFNGDGKLDLVTANSNGTVTVLPGKGDGTFGSGLTATAGGNPTSVAVGDLSGDHKADLVVGTRTGLETLLGKGDGTFQLKQTVTFSQSVDGMNFTFGVTSVAVGSFRGNGENDVVAASQEGLAVLLGNGDGTVQNPVFPDTAHFAASVTVGDFNGDGKLDIITGSSLSFLAGRGDGTFAPPTTTHLGEAANVLAAGDFRADGKLDLVLATNQSGNTVTVLSGNGDGTFGTTPVVASPGQPSNIAVGDFNGDGKPDLVTAGASVSVLLNNGNGNGTFRQGPVLNLSQGFGGPVVVGDFNGDGKQDIAVAEGDLIEIFLGNGDGTFQAPKTVRLGTNEGIQEMVVGHLAKGGLPDLVITVQFLSGPAVGGVQVLLNKGGGNFAKGQTVPFNSPVNGLATADFNGDGNLDLVTDSFLPGGTRILDVLRGNGNGTFKAPIATPLSLNPNIIATGDFNGDGQADLVLVDFFDVHESILVLKGNGDGTFQSPLVLKSDSPLTFAKPVVGDFFGDGHMSFAVTTGLGYVTIYRGNGDGTFQAPVNYVADFNSGTGLVAADFNNDGKLDLAAPSSSDGTVSILLNTSPKPATGAVATTTTLAADNTTVVSGQTVTLTATVSAASGTAVGTVTFFDGSQVLGQVALDPNGQARLLVTFHGGTHSLHASFAGIEPFTASASGTVSETVNKDATTTTLGLEVVSGSFVVLTANVVPAAPGSGTPTGTLTFFDGTTIIATVPVSGIATFYVNLGSGKHTLKAVYGGDSDFLGSVSNTIDITL
jgi:hypothetical protein